MFDDYEYDIHISVQRIILENPSSVKGQSESLKDFLDSVDLV